MKTKSIFFILACLAFIPTEAFALSKAAPQPGRSVADEFQKFVGTYLPERGCEFLTRATVELDLDKNAVNITYYHRYPMDEKDQSWGSNQYVDPYGTTVTKHANELAWISEEKAQAKCDGHCTLWNSTRTCRRNLFTDEGYDCEDWKLRPFDATWFVNGRLVLQTSAQVCYFAKAP